MQHDKVLENEEAYKQKQEDIMLENYSISENNVSGFTRNFSAICGKRFTLMRRGWRNMLFEILTPVLFVIAGFGLIKLTFLYDSPPRKVQTKLFPLP